MFSAQIMANCHVFVAAHGHPNGPQVGGCAAPFAVVEEPNGQLGPTPTNARVCIPACNKRDGPSPINGVKLAVVAGGWWLVGRE